MNSAKIVLLLIGFAIPAVAQPPNPERSPVDADLWRSAWATADTDGDDRIGLEEAPALNPGFAEWFRRGAREKMRQLAVAPRVTHRHSDRREEPIAASCRSCEELRNP